MFFANIKRAQRQVGVKMMLWYLAFFVLSCTLLFAGFYVLFSQALTFKDREILEARFKEYSLIYNQGGVNSIKEYLNGTEKEAGRLFVRVENSTGQILFSSMPFNLENFDIQEFESKYEKRDKAQKWFYVKTRSNEDDLEVISDQLADGRILQIGKSIDDRDDLIEVFQGVFFIILIFSIFLGGFGGIILSKRLLNPLRILISTIREINLGEENLRVPSLESEDELAELSLLFNKMLDRLQLSNESMRQTLDTIAHELRTPLTSIRGHSEMTLNQKNLSPSVKTLLENTIEGIDEVLAEFKTMTEITEVETGLQNLKKENTDMVAMCEQVIDLYEIVADQKNIKIVFEPQKQVIGYCDSRKMKQVLANLFDNAIKYSNAGSVISLNCFSDDKATVISVADQGIGIPELELSQIFKRLYRGQNSRSEKGLGLGLSLVKSIVRAHHGTVVVQSQIDKGSLFTVRIPVK